MITIKQHTRYKWELLLLLWLAYFFNQADRQLFSVVLPLIKKELHFTDAQLGLIASMLVWTYGCLVPVAGFLGDRFSKKRMIVISLLFWSTATFFTGVCSTMLQFVLLRGIATGGSEAMYAPSANSLIGNHHNKTRSLALSIHQTAVYAGIILSGLVAGWLAEKYGWRYAFFAFGTAGILLSLVMFKRVAKEPKVQEEQSPHWGKVFIIILQKPTFILLTLGFACMVFVNVGYLTWMPSLLVEKFSLSLSQAGFSSMFYHHIGAFVGVVLGGLITDKLAKHKPVWRLGIQSIALLLGSPFIYCIGQASTQLATYAGLFLFGIFRGMYDANIFASLFEIVQSSIRSTASGIMLMFAFLIGASSPYLLGILKPKLGLQTGMSGMSFSYILGAFFIGIAAVFFFKKDQQTVVANA